jgi:hypothetical protein
MSVWLLDCLSSEQLLLRFLLLWLLGRVLINAQMSGFRGEAEILSSTKALPVFDSNR